MCYVSDLNERTKYQFFVTAENGVSGEASVTPTPVLVSNEILDDNTQLIIGIVAALVVGIGLAAILFVIFVVFML